jgi:hypothetical protein
VAGKVQGFWVRGSGFKGSKVQRLVVTSSKSRFKFLLLAAGYWLLASGEESVMIDKLPAARGLIPEKNF